jgi:adenine-specific DNA-methyltransferase
VTARELLNESGSCFVQISDENVHHVREVMDEVFGHDNFAALINFVKNSGQTTKLLSGNCDYIIWYAKNIEVVKYHQLFYSKEAGSDLAERYDGVELADETRRPIKPEEKDNPELLPRNSKLYTLQPAVSAGFNKNTTVDYVLNGKTYHPGVQRQWKTTVEGMNNLAKLNRLVGLKGMIYYVRYLQDFPAYAMGNNWTDTQDRLKKNYVVETVPKAIQRCLLMTSDPGDIVLDPTCGSGTTAYVAEQWGRRWITTDTSRVALALARTRLMTAKYPFYKLKGMSSPALSFRTREAGEKSSSREERFLADARNDKEGAVEMTKNETVEMTGNNAARISDGFEYASVPHVTLKSLANDEEPETEILYDKPLENKKVVRVAGPFTVESLSPHRVSDAQDMVSTERFVNIVIGNLLRAGVQTGEKGARVEFENLDILPAGPEVQAVGEYKTKDGLKKVAVAIGPEFGSVDDDFIRDAVTVAKRFADLLVIAATSFDASAHSEPSQVDNLRVMKVKINPDLSMGDLLKKTGSGNLFLAFGEPEVKLNETKEGIVIEILGVDVYDPVKSEIRTSGSGNPDHDIAAWFIDTNYNGEAFFVTHAYFLGADKPFEKLKKALKADINEDLWEELYSTTSRPFPKPKTGRIAVKVINHYGDEVMKVVEVK